ncbi:hypothetical protein BVC80_1787g62 [Macleaya cordata]|uniref:Uncharacterized protein n=1 Tax=Macleaya cordata TaxID=56857 RepID=A0A200QU82_MACCD|nr:hypothetical protein BVC80_1787g62 [Macleaya cordata]
MEEEKDDKEIPSRGNEWEVVSLTASTYAAAPGPESLESNNDNHDNELDINDEETSRAMFMSGHFVFPPSQHENLPLVCDDKSGAEVGGPTKKSGLDIEEGDRSDKDNEESWNIKGMTAADELHGIQFFDETGKRLSVRASEFEEGRSLLGLDVVDKEQSIYSAGNFSSIHNEADISVSNLSDENLIIPESSDPLLSNSDSPLDSTSPTKEKKFNESGLPCEAWWKKRAASLFAQAKDANAFWSVFVAAALMGLVILGQRWQSQQVKLQSVINDEVFLAIQKI